MPQDSTAIINAFCYFRQDEIEHKNESRHEKLRAKNDNQKPKRFAQNKNHKVKNFAYTASKPRLQKDDDLQNEPAKKPAQDTSINFGKTAFTKNTWQAMSIYLKTDRRTKHNLRNWQNPITEKNERDSKQASRDNQ